VSIEASGELVMKRSKWQRVRKKSHSNSDSRFRPSKHILVCSVPGRRTSPAEHGSDVMPALLASCATAFRRGEPSRGESDFLPASERLGLTERPLDMVTSCRVKTHEITVDICL